LCCQEEAKATPGTEEEEKVKVSGGRIWQTERKKSKKCDKQDAGELFIRTFQCSSQVEDC
jgi:hypothetical protein